MTIPKSINLANSTSVFDEFKKLSVGVTGTDGSDVALEGVQKDGKVVELKCAQRKFAATGKSEGALPDASALRATLKTAVDDVLARTESRLCVEVWENKDNVEAVSKKIADLKKLVDEKFGITSSTKELLTSEVSKIVVGVEFLVSKLRNKNAEELLALDNEGLKSLVEDAHADVATQENLSKEIAAGRKAPETLTKAEAAGQETLNKLAAEAAAGREVMEIEDQITTQFNADYDVAPSEMKLVQRCRTAIDNDAYCKAQARKDFHLSVCSAPAVDDIDPYAHVPDKIDYKTYAGETTSIVHKLAEEARAKGKEPLIFVHNFADQRICLGYFKTCATTQEEALCRALKPDVFAAMKGLGLFMDPDKNQYDPFLYTHQPNGLPNMDVVSGTILDAQVDVTGGTRLKEPDKMRLFFGAGLSFARNVGNQDQKGHLVHLVKCHEEVLGPSARTDAERNECILNADKITKRFIARLKDTVKKLDEAQYRRAIKIMDFCDDPRYSSYIAGELKDKDVDARIDAIIALAKKDDDPLFARVEQNYQKTLHSVFAGRFQAMREEVLKERVRRNDPTFKADWVDGAAGCGAFENLPAEIAAVVAREFVKECGDVLNFVYAQWNNLGDQVDTNPGLDDRANIWQNAVRTAFEELKAEKAAYTEDLRKQLKNAGIVGTDKMDYAALVKEARKLDEARRKDEAIRRTQRNEVNRFFDRLKGVDPSKIDIPRLLSLADRLVIRKKWPAIAEIEDLHENYYLLAFDGTRLNGFTVLQWLDEAISEGRPLGYLKLGVEPDVMKARIESFKAEFRGLTGNPDADRKALDDLDKNILETLFGGMKSGYDRRLEELNKEILKISNQNLQVVEKLDERGAAWLELQVVEGKSNKDALESLKGLFLADIEQGASYPEDEFNNELWASLPAPAEPKVANAAPEVVNAEPEVVNAEPELANPEPEVVNAEPEVANAAPEVVNAEPEVANAEPAIIKETLDELRREAVNGFFDRLNGVDPGTINMQHLLSVAERLVVRNQWPAIAKIEAQRQAFNSFFSNDIRTMLSNLLEAIDNDDPLLESLDLGLTKAQMKREVVADLRVAKGIILAEGYGKRLYDYALIIYPRLWDPLFKNYTEGLEKLDKEIHDAYKHLEIKKEYSREKALGLPKNGLELQVTTEGNLKDVLDELRKLFLDDIERGASYTDVELAKELSGAVPSDNS